MPVPSVKSTNEDEIFIISPEGYVDESAGEEIFRIVSGALAEGYNKFILDFTDSPVINSQGIAQIIELCETVVDGKNGSVVFIGLNELTQGVFKMVGLLYFGKAFPDRAAAISELRNS